MRLRGWALGAAAVVLAVPGITSPATAAPEAVVRPAVRAAVGEALSVLPPEVRAAAKARETGRRVEVATLRTETSQVYANPDGTKTMEQHAVPVRVRQGNGWATPDPTLLRGVDGSIRPKAAVMPIVLSGGGSSHLLTIGQAGKQISMGWPGKLPAPRLEGARATYPEVLPGVDLRIDVGVEGFSHLLVVKSRQAASNPALRTLRYPISSDSLKLAVRMDGTTVATHKGEQVFTAPAPTMWDAKDTTAKLGIALVGKTMTLTPDQRMLTDPATKFPVEIDPSIGGSLVNWLHVNDEMGTQNAWNYDRTNEGAKVGRAYRDTAHLYRSMFLLRTTSGAQTIAGSQIVSATFRITINKTPSSTPKPVQLWWLNDLSTSTYIDWDNNQPYWRQNLATVNGEAYPWTEDNPIEFSNEPLRAALQDVANGRRTTVSFGLKASDEGVGEEAQLQWKKFHPSSAVISITYNTAPRVPLSVNFIQARPCGTATAPTAIIGTQPQFSAIANDPDAGDNVITTLQIRDEAGTVAYSSDVGPTVSGAAFSWQPVALGALAANTLYRYRAFTRDGVTTGPASPDCYFFVDARKPAVPQIVSADFPDGEPVRKLQETGTVTFKPGTAADTDIVEYAFGFQQDKTVLRVKAGAGGIAAVPITLHADPDTGLPIRDLYVKAIDAAGNQSTRRAWTLRAFPREVGDPVIPKTRGDTNGDGKADVAAVLDHGFGRTGVWNMTSATGSVFHNGYMGWDSGQGAGYALYRTRQVQGDLDGDGLTDIALFREGAGRQVWLYKLMSDGMEYDAPPFVWTSEPNGWPLSTARIVSGDIDGDGKDDIVVQNAGTGDNWTALVFQSSKAFTAPTTWTTSAAGNPWSSSTPLLADVDGDGDDDLLSMRNLTGCRTAVDLYRSDRTGFAAAQRIYDSGAGTLCWEKSRPAVTDVDGDHKDDVVVLYEHAANDAGLTVLRSSGTALTGSSWWRGALDLARSTLTAGDDDGDGRGDAAVLYASGADGGSREVLTFRSSGTAFGDKSLAWGGPVGAVTGPKFDIEHRTYELVNRNSGKCLNVLGASTADGVGFVQYGCRELNLNARFHIDAVGGTEQYAIKPVHTATGGGPLKCATYIESSNPALLGQLTQMPCANGDPTANQQVTLEYVEGASYDTVVRLKVAHGGKCLSIVAGTLNDLDPVQQEACGQGANQQWILRPTFNATQLGAGGTARHRTEAATSATQVLDITNCQTADGSDVRMWYWVTGSPCQGWQLRPQGDDVYKIVDPNSGKVLDIEGCSKLPQGNVYTWTENNFAECQLWRIEPSPGGSYSVIQVSSGLSLDVAGCSSAAGANVSTWFYHGGACQRWFFKRL